MKLPYRTGVASWGFSVGGKGKVGNSVRAAAQRIRHTTMRILYSYEGKRRIFDRETTQVVIGRPKNGVAVDLDLTPDQHVSRPHARIWLEDGQYWIEDLNSAPGTLVGKEEIKQKGKRRLQGDEIIRIGQTSLQVEIPGTPGSPPFPQIQTPEPDTEIAETLDASRSVFAPAKDASPDEMEPLNLVYELPLQLAQETNLDALLQRIIERLVVIISGAGRGALLVKERETGNLLLKAHLPAGEPAVSMTLARRAMEQKQAFVWQRGGPNTEFSISRPDIASGMYAPLLWKGETLGVVCVDNCSVCVPFDAEDLRLMLAVAEYAAMAVATHQLQDDLRNNAALLGNLLVNFSPRVRDRLLDKARRGRLRPGGEKSEITILFSDIRGFTRMSKGMETDDIVDMLNDYFPALIDSIFRNDGTIDKFVGDAILAVFGSPEPDAQQHEKAIRAALEMQEAVTQLNRVRAARNKVTCQIGIGIHCGEVLHGFIGSAERMEFTVIGDAVNRASRYCDGAQAGEILISPEVHQHAWRMIQAEATSIPTKHEGNLPAFRVKGAK